MLFGRSLEGVKNMPGMCLKGACKVSGSTSSCQWDESDVICHDVILCHDVIIYDDIFFCYRMCFCWFCNRCHFYPVIKTLWKFLCTLFGRCHTQILNSNLANMSSMKVPLLEHWVPGASTIFVKIPVCSGHLGAGCQYNAQWANSWGQKVLIFFRNSLIQSVFELEKCSFF